jgi:hypothetical protein
MNVALMTYIVEYPVAGGIKFQGYGNTELDDSQIGGKMPAGTGDMVDEECADLGAERIELCIGKRMKILRGMQAL